MSELFKVIESKVEIKKRITTKSELVRSIDDAVEEFYDKICFIGSNDKSVPVDVLIAGGYSAYLFGATNSYTDIDIWGPKHLYETKDDALAKLRRLMPDQEWTDKGMDGVDPRTGNPYEFANLWVFSTEYKLFTFDVVFIDYCSPSNLYQQFDLLICKSCIGHRPTEFQLFTHSLYHNRWHSICEELYNSDYGCPKTIQRIAKYSKRLHIPSLAKLTEELLYNNHLYPFNKKFY